MEPDSNQQSSTSGMRFITPPHFLQGKVILSTICLCKSSTFCPPNFSNSSTLPITFISLHVFFCRDAKFCVSTLPPQRQIGIALAQNLCLEIDQSRAPSSHCPNRPSFMCFGVQFISSASFNALSFISVIFTNHEAVA